MQVALENNIVFVSSMLWASDYSQSTAPQKLWPTVPQA